MREVISWHDYFMNIAKAVASRSKDPNTQVGAVLVNKQNQIRSTGYNGMPSRMIETTEIWRRPTKYSYVVHAEANAIINKPNFEGCVLYSTLHPCAGCATLIAAARTKINVVIYLEEKNNDDELLAKNIFKLNNIKLLKLKGL